MAVISEGPSTTRLSASPFRIPFGKRPCRFSSMAWWARISAWSEPRLGSSGFCSSDWTKKSVVTLAPTRRA